MDQSVFRQRLWVVTVCVAIAAGIFAIKLFYVQILHGHLYSNLADRQYVTNTSQLFDRGGIYFTQKDGTLVSAATLRSGFKIAINTSTAGDPEKLYEKIGILLGANRDTFIAQASKKNDPYEEVAVNVDEETASKITAMKLPGVSVLRMNWRFYPAGMLASHAIGFMGWKGDDFAGRYGVERFYDSVLSRTDERLYVNFFAEVFSDINKFIKSEDEVEGDVVMTIEPSVQKTLETAVQGVQKKWDSGRVGGIVMDPKSGEIIAMALDNGFDINNTRSVTNVMQFSNPLVENDFEMGSIMKPVIMAIALDQGVVTPGSTYFDQGFVKVGDKVINNFDRKGRGLVDMQIVLNQSLNTGMVHVMQKMKKDDFKKQWLAFGFGEKTGIDLPAEAVGLVGNLNTGRDVEFANASFGQGIAVTAVEMIRALAVLGNGGRLVTPHVAREIQYPSGSAKKLEWPIGTELLLKPESGKTITQMLVKVFDGYNDGKYKLEHYAVAAKTGTAQIPDNERGGYYTDRNLHTFMAYFPANDPKFIVFLYNEFPKKGAQFSSETLLPPFVGLAKFLINYYDVPPDR